MRIVLSATEPRAYPILHEIFFLQRIFPSNLIDLVYIYVWPNDLCALRKILCDEIRNFSAHKQDYHNNAEGFIRWINKS